MPAGRRTHPRPRWLRVVAAGAAGVVSAVLVELGLSGCCPTVARSPAQDTVAVGRFDAPSSSTGVIAPVAKGLGGGLLVVAVDERLVARDAATNRVEFAVGLDDLGLHDHVAHVSIRPFHGGVAVAGGARVALLDTDGTVRWQSATGFVRTRVVVADDERIVLLGETGTETVLQVAQAADGAVRFGRAIAALVGVEEQTALVRDAGQTFGVTALSLTDGSVRWVSPMSSAPADDG